ncbi:TPA: hypothetical protein DIV55_05175 [Patescibacteria group bacterium]|nr:hypothetical protein [Patescibacteria group bacterium]
MRKTPIYFAHTLQEAEWVRTKISLENSQTFKIIATSLATQLFFFKKRILADDGSAFLSKRFYSKTLEILIRKSHYWYKKLRPYFKSIVVSEIYLYDLLQTPLESAFLSVFYSEYLLRQIQANISSPHFYISAAVNWQLGRWEPTQSTVATYIKDTIPENVILYQPKRQISFPSLKLGLNSVHTLLQLPEYLRQITLRSRTKSVSKGNVDFLMFSSGGGLYQQHPVLKGLRHLNGLIVTGSSSDLDASWIQTTGIPVYPLSAFSTQQLHTREVQVEQALRVLINRLRIHPPQVAPSSNKLAQLLVEMTRLVFLAKYKQTVRQTLLAEQALRTLKPKLVITTHDPGPSALPFVLKAKQQGRKTLVVLHGWQSIKLGAEHASEHAAVWGNYVANWFCDEFGKAKMTIHPVGFPFLESFFPGRKVQPLTALKQKTNIKIGFILTLYPPANIGEFLFFKNIFSVINQRNFKGTILLRPRVDQNVSEIFALARYLNIPFAVPNSSLTEFIGMSDVIVCWDTTAIYWVMMQGKPLIYTTPLWSDGMQPISKYGAAWIPHKAEDIFNIIEKLRYKKEIEHIARGQHRLLQQVIGLSKVSAAVRTQKLISKLITSA